MLGFVLLLADTIVLFVVAMSSSLDSARVCAYDAAVMAVYEAEQGGN